jgi:hypothetical protein
LLHGGLPGLPVTTNLEVNPMRTTVLRSDRRAAGVRFSGCFESPTS